MERNNSLPAKPRCHENLGFDWQTLIGVARVLEDSFLFLGVTTSKKKVRERLATPPTPTTLFTTPALGPKQEPRETKPPVHQTMMARRVAILALVQFPDPKQKSYPFTHQIRPFTEL